MTCSGQDPCLHGGLFMTQDLDPRTEVWAAWPGRHQVELHSGHLNGDNVLKVSCTLKNHERKW